MSITVNKGKHNEFHESSIFTQTRHFTSYAYLMIYIHQINALYDISKYRSQPINNPKLSQER